MFQLDQHTIFLSLAGSQAHGTARVGSDVDLRGVCVAPLRQRLSLFGRFEQFEGLLEGELAATVRARLAVHATASRALDHKIECVIFDVAKFVELCANANPNALEILFADERDWIVATPVWRRLYDERYHFLTRQVQQTFLGYALAQLKKIKSHRSWLLNPPTQKPTREGFGLPSRGSGLSRDDQNRIEESIADKLRTYGVENIEMPKATRIAVREQMEGFIRDVLLNSAKDTEDQVRSAATAALGIPPDVAASLNAEKKYRVALKHWESYQTWSRQRNRARAELEHKYGYDTKHAMHLIRLMRMGLEVLERGELSVRRADAAELGAIRDGAMTFDELLAAAAELNADMERALATTKLHESVDRARLDELAFGLMTATGK